jgi:hypothetical protein
MDDCEHFWVNISSKRQRAWQCSHCGELRLDDPAQKREWVGLTAGDLVEIPPSCYEGAIWADARLKEKNSD